MLVAARRLPRSLGVMKMTSRKPSPWFYLAVVPPVLLAWRLVWEMTALSWERGPQMVGYSLMHSELGLVFFVALFASLAWAIVIILITLFSSARHNLTNLIGALIVCAAAALTFTPYGLWVQLFADRIAHGPHATEFLVHMAALGEVPAVQALLDQGVPINESNAQGIRAIEAAENAKQPAMRAFLAQRGGTDKRY